MTFATSAMLDLGKLAEELATGCMPKGLEKLDILGCGVGDEGAKLLANALLQSGRKTLSLACSTNGIGLAGQSELLKAFEALRGFSLGDVSVCIMNPPFFPVALSRAVPVAYRRVYETGRNTL